MEDQERFAKTLFELASEVESTIPYAMNIGYVGVNVDMSLEVAQEFLKAVKIYQEHIHGNTTGDIDSNVQLRQCRE